VNNMAILFTKKDAQKDLPVIEDSNLKNAVDLALWLYLDKHWSFKWAIKKAVEKHPVKPKNQVEKILRSIIPEEVFWERMNNAGKNIQTNNKDKKEVVSSAIRSQKLKKMEKDGKKHISDIVKK
tara:strand:+ start:277 stop:648 length:372 start_codon:yes stop_codon:yes gene_type:complete